MSAFPRDQRDHLLTVQDVATRLRVSRSTVWRMVASGRLPPPVYPSWRTARWLAAECDQYLANWLGQSRSVTRHLEKTRHQKAEAVHAAS